MHGLSAQQAAGSDSQRRSAVARGTAAALYVMKKQELEALASAYIDHFSEQQVWGKDLVLTKRDTSATTSGCFRRRVFLREQ
jgi:hypothetical protein